jgi:tetratricopeptide (TPR) repeat protein/tRNA A-37 threonylcarbamoyl transferase component Bud32
MTNFGPCIGEDFYPLGTEDAKPIGFRIFDIKEGGMGKVYLAHMLDNYEETGRKTALKTLRDEYVNDPHVVARFLREAEVWARMGAHDNIVRALYVTIHDERPYILLEYIDGPDLRSLLRRGPIPVKQAVKFAAHFCKGMIHAAEQMPGFVHRDIKPENCLIDEFGYLRVTDFGLSKAIDGQDASFCSVKALNSADTGYFKTLTGLGGMGTFPYMPPEQFDDFAATDVTGDIYSFGIMFYEMLVGHRPFSAATPEEWYEAHHHQEVGIPSHVNPEIPIELSMFVTGCVSKEPEKRWPDFSCALMMLAWAQNPDGFELKAVPADKAPQRPAETAVTLCGRASSLRTLGKFHEAMEVIDKAIEMTPDDYLVWHIKGLIAMDLKDHREAIRCFDREIECDRARPGALEDKVKVFQQIEDYERALDVIEVGIERFPNLSRLRVRQAAILDNLARPDEAERSLRIALTQEPDNIGALHDLAVHLQNKGEYAQALEPLHKLINFIADGDGANLDNALTLRAKSLFALEHFKDAHEELERIVSTYPQNANALYLLGILTVYPKYGIGGASLDKGLTIIKRAASLGHDGASEWLDKLESGESYG